MSNDEFEVRALATRSEYEACVELQRDIWGQDFVDVVPATILMVSQRVGGVASGAFDPSGRLVGFVFGISGFRDQVAVHWSDMLAVRPDARRRGLGRRLKLHQRETLLAAGIKKIYWSFDPLIAGNAHFNLVTLGALPVEYIVDMYGDTSSELHQGLDTDRLIIEWCLTEPAVERALAGDPRYLPDAARTGPVIPTHQTGADATALPRAPWVRLEIPADVEHLKATAPELAREWQFSFRRAFTAYLNEGQGRVIGICRDETTGRYFYAVDTTAGMGLPPSNDTPRANGAR